MKRKKAKVIDTKDTQRERERERGDLYLLG